MMSDREKLFVIMQKISDVAIRNNDIPIEKASKFIIVNFCSAKFASDIFFSQS